MQIVQKIFSDIRFASVNFQPFSPYLFFIQSKLLGVFWPPNKSHPLVLPLNDTFATTLVVVCS